MDLSFTFFCQQLASNPVLLVTVFLTLCVIFVNGWTDAPNAIATCVSTRSMDVDAAIVMAAVCNFVGVLVMTMINSTVAMTITNMVNFGGQSSQALIALCAALFAIVFWAVLAWYFGILERNSRLLPHLVIRKQRSRKKAQKLLDRNRKSLQMPKERLASLKRKTVKE